MVEECVFLPACGGNPTIQKKFTGFMDYADRRENINGLRRRRKKRKRFPRFTGFPRSGGEQKRITVAGGR